MPIIGGGAENGYFERLDEDGPDTPDPYAQRGPVSYAPHTSSTTIIGYWIAFTFAAMDANLVTINFDRIEDDLGFISEEVKGMWLGRATFSNTMVSAAAALLVGHLADRMSRPLLFASLLIFGKLVCLAFFVVSTYEQLYMAYSMMGVTVGGLAPLACSMAADMFPVDSRASMLGIWGTALVAGPLLGEYLVDVMPPTFHWKMSFAVVALLGLMVAVLIALNARDPKRGQHEEALRERQEAMFRIGEPWYYTAQITGTKLSAIVAKPSNLLGYLQAIPAALPWALMGTYLTAFLVGQNGFSDAAAAHVLLFHHMGGGLGVLLGALIGQEIYNQSRSGMPMFLGACAIIGLAPCLALINRGYTPNQFAEAQIVAGVAGLLAGAAHFNVQAILLNVNRPEIRGTALGLFGAVVAVSRAFAPLFVAAFLPPIGSPHSAYNTLIWVGLLSGVGIILQAFTFGRDERVLQAQLSHLDEMQMHAEMDGMPPGGENYDPIVVDLAAEPDETEEERLARIAANTDPNDAELFKRMRLFESLKSEGNAHFANQRWEQAIESFTKCLEVDPADGQLNSLIYCNRAAAFQQAGDLDKAVDDCTMAIQVDNSHRIQLKAHQRRGRCYQQKEEHEKAVRDFEMALRMHHTHETQAELREAKMLLKRAKSGDDYYTVLGVSRDADAAAIKKAYKQQALKCHPDKLAGCSDKEKEDAEKQFKKVGEAYAVLSDEEKKKEYDEGTYDDGSGKCAADSDEDDFQMFFNGRPQPHGGRGRGTYGRSPFNFHM
uniref:Major facilitator superfamily (MFS) profile domain-containing protein n=1 Tax=Eutreptiella gymnastica TaxID=73025 RepID=A0A7S1N9A6_9EUGL|mmetsp:Transcript_140270/g.244303  ORF Transcript_140270/g.244303 Transcript_140270/m.244303 type:complete len:774 (+) Transcript_140270:68-2389(+)